MSLRGLVAKWPRLVRGRVILVVATVAVAAFAASAYRAARDAVEVSREAHRSWETRAAIDDALDLVVDAEAGVRGFLLTGKREWLEPLEKARRTLPVALADVRSRLREDPPQLERLVRLESLLAASLARLYMEVRSGPASGHHALSELLAGSEAAMEAARREAAQLTVAEERRLAERRRRQSLASPALRVAMAVSLGGGLTAMAMALLLWSDSKRTQARLVGEIAVRTEAEQALVQLKRDLEERVETRAAELALANTRLQRELDERQRMQEELERANTRLTHGLRDLEQRSLAATNFARMIDTLQACRSLDEAAVVVARWMDRLFPGTSGFLGLLHPSRDLVEAATTWGTAASMEVVFGLEDCWALRQGRIHVLGERAESLPCPHLSGTAASAACLPLTAQGELLGVLHLRSAAPRLGLPWARDEADHLGLALLTAGSVALALANLRLRESLRHQSIRDPLTGLFNRRYLEESAEGAVRRSLRSGRPIAVVMLDLDHFKALNDEHGHAAGDAVLQELGVLLLGLVRAGDIACRYGGEEFVLILPEASLSDAHGRAEGLRESVTQLQVRLPKGTARLTASLGVAALPEHGTAAEALLRAADAALYRAKAEGRNRVVVAPLQERAAPTAATPQPLAALPRGRRKRPTAPGA
ncbi:MAG: diguanylate cyclase [Acidobacteria bacterium]|nr:diguanylate cyclase [Acidobacteriota bacterium]